MATRYFAIDLEFIKCRGLHFARSIAFVPFVARRQDTNSFPSSTTGRAYTWFSQAPTVLTIESNEVMRTADVLPCGHVLHPYLSEHFGRSESLEEIKKAFQRESELSLEANRTMQQALRRTKRLRAKNALEHANGSGDKVSESSACTEVEPHEVPLNKIEDSRPYTASELSTPSDPYLDDPLSELNEFDRLLFPLHSHEAANPSRSPMDAASQRNLQIRTSIPYHFELLDPYTIPNICLLEEAPLRRLYTDPTDSSTFTDAVRYLSRIRAYGRGKGKQKALGFLFHYYPEFAQAVLRASFPNAGAWCDFLRTCAELVRGELLTFQDVHQQRKYPLTVSPSSNTTADSAPPYYRECTSLKTFSVALNKTWAHFLSQGNVTKFFTYGNVDAKVLFTTLRLSCDEYRQRDHLSTQFSLSKKDFSRQARTIPVSSPPKDMLLSPFQAKVIDVTRSSLFSGSGFIQTQKKIPGLAEALQRVASCDSTAEAVLSIQRPHDPLWDAQALACVCVGSGIAQGVNFCPVKAANEAASGAK